MKVHNVFITTNDLNEQYLNIVMDYYDKSLFEVINESAMKCGARQPLAINKSTELQQKVFIYQIIKGLSYIHSLKICHRDIKPHNMLVKGW
jgi:serine/threonine protein kinase